MNAVVRAGFAALAVAASAAAACAQATQDDVEESTRRIEVGLLTHHVIRGGPAGGLALEERMRFYGVPGVSVAVIDGGRLAWARGWGVTAAGGGAPVDTATLFQAGSISKPVAAVAVMRLVERGELDLDANVNELLRSWRLPENELTSREKVTLRRLLSHTAGTTVHGFPGYRAGEPVPTLVQVLDGEEPANTAPVRVDLVPGTRTRYSGGGTTIAQLVAMDANGSSFAALARELVLEPVGMRRSTYEQPLPASLASAAATGHKGDGSPVPGRYHTYPEQAAAGLWTTPSDLARLAIEIQRAIAGDGGRLLSPAAARRMLTPVAGPFGIGFVIEGEDDERVFGHGGANEGFRAELVVFARRGQGAVVMTNGDGGGDLSREILRAIAREYGWPAFRPVERTVAEVAPEALAEYAGSYRFRFADWPRPLVLTIAHGPDGLHGTMPDLGWNRRTLLPAGDDTFFFLENPGELAFERGEDGEVRAAVFRDWGQPFRGERQ